MNRLVFILITVIPLFARSQAGLKLPVTVEKVLQESGNNRPQLVKAISYFRKKSDPLKMQAIYFLIANMDIHYSANYYWEDSLKNRIPFNELVYADFNAAVKAFDKIKTQYKGVHPQAYYYRDIDSIKADFLIDNVERAFEYWKNPKVKGLSFTDFCEYVLPYRVNIEPLQDWRKIYHERFASVSDSAKGKSIDKTIHYFADNTKSWFTNTWELEQRKEPLPRLGPLQLLARAKGNCDDIAGLEVYMLRSQGYPAAEDNVPFWATSAGTHFFNNTIDEQMKPLPFDISSNGVKINNFEREPSKVIRETYSKQPTALASFTPGDYIPSGFMRTNNYIDVTATYSPSSNLTCELIEKPVASQIAYACVFSGGIWQPTWWGNVKKSSVTFTNMSKGVVYLPVYYLNKKFSYAGFPKVLGYKEEHLLKPDTINRKNVTINWQDRYLIFRPGKKYKLFYWNYGWKPIGEKIAGDKTVKLDFENVPENALLILIPEYSEGKERPFTINNLGERQWW